MFVARSDFSSPVRPQSGRPPARALWAFTDARGDASDVVLPEAGPGEPRTGYGRFNLGVHVGDELGSVQANRARLIEALGAVPAGVAYMNQVHGRDVVVADGPWDSTPPDADGIVTTRPGLGLAVLVADCVPVLLADPEAGVVGAAHAGRAGMTLGVVTATVERMRGLGAERLQAVVGPSICGRCYEVPEAMRADAARVRPASASVTWRGTPGIDVAAGVVDELVACGAEVTRVPGCTLESPELYSHRRNPRTGRLAGVIVLEDPHEQNRRDSYDQRDCLPEVTT